MNLIWQFQITLSPETSCRPTCVLLNRKKCDVKMEMMNRRMRRREVGGGGGGGIFGVGSVGGGY